MFFRKIFCLNSFFLFDVVSRFRSCSGGGGRAGDGVAAGGGVYFSILYLSYSFSYMWTLLHHHHLSKTPLSLHLPWISPSRIQFELFSFMHMYECLIKWGKLLNLPFHLRFLRFSLLHIHIIILLLLSAFPYEHFPPSALFNSKLIA